jgi:hypothetical protein
VAKVKPFPWVEESRERIPDSLRLFFSDSNYNYNCATMDYRVWERNRDTGETRVREVKGDPLYEKDRRDLESAFAHARIACREIQSAYEVANKRKT